MINNKAGAFFKLIVEIILVVLVCSSVSALMLGVDVMYFIKTIFALVLLVIMVIFIVIKLVDDYFED